MNLQKFDTKCNFFVWRKSFFCLKFKSDLWLIIVTFFSVHWTNFCTIISICHLICDEFVRLIKLWKISIWWAGLVCLTSTDQRIGLNGVAQIYKYIKTNFIVPKTASNFTLVTHHHHRNMFCNTHCMYCCQKEQYQQTVHCKPTLFFKKGGFCLYVLHYTHVQAIEPVPSFNEISLFFLYYSAYNEKVRNSIFCTQFNLMWPMMKNGDTRFMNVAHSHQPVHNTAAQNWYIVWNMFLSNTSNWLWLILSST